jgi:hypothetical protein
MSEQALRRVYGVLEGKSSAGALHCDGSFIDIWTSDYSLRRSFISGMEKGRKASEKKPMIQRFSDSSIVSSISVRTVGK